MKRNLDEKYIKLPLKAILLSMLIIFVCATAFCGCVSAEDRTFQVYSWDDLKDNLSNHSEQRTVILMDNVKNDTYSQTPKSTILININGTKILDLNGYQINVTDICQGGNTGSSFAVINVGKDSNLTVVNENETAVGSIELTAAQLHNKSDNYDHAYGSYVILNSQGNVTINGGTIIHHAGTYISHCVDVQSGDSGNANLTVNGGKLISKIEPAIRGYCNSNKYVVNITINGGEISGDWDGIWIQQGHATKYNQYSLTINGGTITGNRRSAIALEILNSSADGYVTSTVINDGTLISNDQQDRAKPTIYYETYKKDFDASKHILTIKDGVKIQDEKDGRILGSEYPITAEWGGKIPLYPSLNITEAYWVKGDDNKWTAVIKEYDKPLTFIGNIANLKCLDLSKIDDGKKATLVNGHSIKSDNKGNLIGWNNTTSTGNIIDLNPESTEFKGNNTYYPLFGYNVTFNGNGGTGTMDNQPFVYNKPQKLNANNFTKDGNNFAGWNTKADGSGTSYTDGEPITIDKETALYAVWTLKPKEYETGEEVEEDEPTPTIEPTPTAEPTPIVTPTQNQTVTPTPTQNQTVTPTPTQNQTVKPTVKPTPEPKTVVIVETEVKFEDNKVITSITVPEGSSGSITFTQTEEKGMDEWIPESIEDSYSFDLSCDGEINGDSEIHFVMS
ncbi:MAG TPA: InlB B-repeat-containing protein, partial [Methanocorpusculum sp.]|nr:InlB B-repeat-containing protein [Methanocorpusculum sp.]